MILLSMTRHSGLVCVYRFGKTLIIKPLLSEYLDFPSYSYVEAVSSSPDDNRMYLSFHCNSRSQYSP